MGLRSWTDLFNTFARHSAAVVGSPWAFVAAVFMIQMIMVLICQRNNRAGRGLPKRSGSMEARKNAPVTDPDQVKPA